MIGPSSWFQRLAGSAAGLQNPFGGQRHLPAQHQPSQQPILMGPTRPGMAAQPGQPRPGIAAQPGQQQTSPGGGGQMLPGAPILLPQTPSNPMQHTGLGQPVPLVPVNAQMPERPPPSQQHPNLDQLPPQEAFPQQTPPQTQTPQMSTEPTRALPPLKQAQGRPQLGQAFQRGTAFPGLRRFLQQRYSNRQNRGPWASRFGR